MRARSAGAVATAALLTTLAFGPPVLAAPKLTPPPSLESIPPQPAAPDSYEVRLVETLPVYVPERQVSGVIRIWGHGNSKLPWMRHLVTLWEDGFRKFQPGVRIDYQMYGSSSGIPALFTGIGDIAILGEEILPEAAAVFEKVKHYPPLGLEIATGSVDVRNFDYAQQFFVHKDNPLAHLTLAQLDAIFGAQHKRGDHNIRTWGQLGLTGAWANKPIIPYGWAIDDSFGLFLQQYLLGGSHEWNCGLKEFIHSYQPDGSIYDHGRQILDALENDRYGIAVSNIRYAGPNVKPLALGLTPSGPFYQATQQTLVEHTYPLTRTIPAFIDHAPGTPVDPKLREFLLYLLSREGQRAITADGRYLPLSAAMVAEQMRKLESATDRRSAVDGQSAAAARDPAMRKPGVLRIWGSEQMSDLVRYWAEGFRKLHPDMVIEPHLMGSATAIPGLYSGLADIALLGRENNVTDDGGFSRPKGYLFQRLELVRGSLDAEDKSAALAVLVHRDNPVSRLTVRQLAAVVGCDGCNGVREVRTWDQLGAGGRWAGKPVHLYSYDAESGTGLFLLHVLLNHSRKVAWDRVTDFKDIKRDDGSIYRASEQIVAALNNDPYGIAISNLRYTNERLKPVAIADSGPFVLPTRETIRALTYPLARHTYAFIDQPPGKPVDPKVKEFLRYALSTEGQSDVQRQRDYLPLDARNLAAQVAKLN